MNTVKLRNGVVVDLLNYRLELNAALLSMLLWGDIYKNGYTCKMSSKYYTYVLAFEGDCPMCQYTATQAGSMRIHGASCATYCFLNKYAKNTPKERRPCADAFFNWDRLKNNESAGIIYRACLRRAVDLYKEEKGSVECCNDECGWVGKAMECVKFKHDGSGKVFCPQCREVVEPVNKEK